MRKSTSKEELASTCFRQMTSFLQHHRQRFLTVAAEHGLTPAHLGALLSLEPGHPQPMRALAALWRCDASNVTWLVDRLEDKGLVARAPLPNDRRVKTVVLTEQGEKVRSTVDVELAQPPAPMLALSTADLTKLSQLLERMAAGTGSPAAENDGAS